MTKSLETKLVTAEQMFTVIIIRPLKSVIKVLFHNLYLKFLLTLIRTMHAFINKLRTVLIK